VYLFTFAARGIACFVHFYCSLAFYTRTCGLAGVNKPWLAPSGSDL